MITINNAVDAATRAQVREKNRDGTAYTPLLPSDIEAEGEGCTGLCDRPLNVLGLRWAAPPSAPP